MLRLYRNKKQLTVDDLVTVKRGPNWTSVWASAFDILEHHPIPWPEERLILQHPALDTLMREITRHIKAIKWRGRIGPLGSYVDARVNHELGEWLVPQTRRYFQMILDSIPCVFEMLHNRGTFDHDIVWRWQGPLCDLELVPTYRDDPAPA